MSRQLNRIRNLISEIDEIQRSGQQKAYVQAQAALAAVESVPAAVTPGRIELSLTPNVIVEFKADGETIEIRKTGRGLEIAFPDGKAFHIPIRDVA